MTKNGSRRPSVRTTAVALAATLLCTCTLLPRPAIATMADDLQAKIDTATQAYNEATATVNDLQTKIDESQAKIDEVTAALPAQRERAEKSLSSLYKMQQGTPGLVSMLLSADDFADFLTTYQHLNAVQRSNNEALTELNQMEGELKAAQQTLQTSQQQASEKKQQAQDSLEEAQAALDELNAQAAAQAAAEAAKAQAQSDAASQPASTDAANTPQTSQAPAASTPSNPSATDGSEVKSDGEWMIGMASAYSVADNTGGNATASGDELSDDSMSVAVPLSQRYLLGRTVQIRYGGKTITAVVNDVGGFAAYGRALDLAGGCWKAFGCSSPYEWGVRAVQYRFL